MSGHVFVVRGDVTRLACDHVLVPTDAGLLVTDGFLPAVPAGVLGPREGGHTPVLADRLPRGAAGGRVVALPPEPGAPQAWLVDVSADAGDGEPDWFADGVREALGRVADACRAVPDGGDRDGAGRGVPGRALPLVALPLVGTGEGGAAQRRDRVIDALLPVLEEATAAHGLDVALVLADERDAAAVQHLRRRRGALEDALPQHADLVDRLAERARAGQLAVFVGAGVSVGAGLPRWSELVRRLGEEAGLGPRELTGLEGLAPQDAATLVADRLGAERLHALLRDAFGPRRHALAHALLAGLPVLEWVTTNFDPLLEDAVAAAGRRLSVLPWEDAQPGVPWLLKLHGDADRPGEVVLTRQDYLDQSAERVALDSVVQSLLLTRHVLFVGFSLVDEHFVRIAHPVSALLSRTRGADAPCQVGTALSLVEDPLRAALWSPDLETVGMVPAPDPDGDGGDPGDGRAGLAAEAARCLEVFLDLLAARTATGQPFLLDERYEALLDPEDRALSEALHGLLERVDPARGGAHADLARLLSGLGARPPGSPPADG